MPTLQPSATRLWRQLLGIALMPGDALLLPVLIVARLSTPGRGDPDDLADRSIIAHGRRHAAAPEDWPRGRRVVDYLAVRVPLGLLDGTLVALIIYGLAVSTQVIIAAATGGAAPLLDLSEVGRITWVTVAMLVPLGGFTLFLGCSALWATSALDRSWWQRCVQDPHAVERHLRATRAEVIEAVDGERRRIERDLHDGAQQVYAVSLDRHGLARALDELAERSALDVRVRCDLTQRPAHAVEVATWLGLPTLCLTPDL